MYIRADGSAVTGRVVDERDGKLFIMESPLTPDVLVEVPADEIESTRVSKVSPMITDLLNTLNEDEVLDLLAYLLTGGNEHDDMFR